jgi:hypothetical protein
MFGRNKRRLAAEAQALAAQTQYVATAPAPPRPQTRVATPASRPFYVPPLELWRPTPQSRMRAMNSVLLKQDASGAAAADVSLRKLARSTRDDDVSLLKRVNVVATSLGKGAAGIRARKVTIIDHSGSMKGLFQSGVVQKLVERELAFGLQIAEEGVVTVIPFDSDIYDPIDVTIDNYHGIVDKRIWRPNKMGGTSLHKPFHAVLEMAKETKVPIFVTCITDGSPEGVHNAEGLATDVICELSQYPVFIKFIAVTQVAYLVKLDTNKKLPRLLDNVNTQFFDGQPNEPGEDANHRPRVTDRACTDEVFAEAETEEWHEWTVRARKEGILRVQV